MFFIPLVGGILCIITIFSSAIYLPTYPNIYYYWIWGLEDFDGLSFNTEKLDILIIGIIIGMLILISGIKLVYSANIVRTEKKSFNDENKTWVLYPLLIISGTLFWIIYVDNFGDGYFVPEGYKVLDYAIIDFGVTGAISGASLTILGFIFNKIIITTNIMDYLLIRPKDKIIIPHKKLPTHEIQKTQNLGALNYCPRCGFKVDYTSKFCPGCGFQF
ncbi:MAG: zinc ribbon domain-containing protein [Candidatus Hodarchaeota archaeon]